MLDDVDIKAMKTGMLFDAKSIRAVVRILKVYYSDRGRTVPFLVCDPVCVSTSGHTLLQADAVEVMIKELFPLTYLLTPNKSEAELLLSQHDLQTSIESLEDMLRASEDLLKLGPQAILLKGGHLTVSMRDVERISSSNPELRIVRSILFEENMEILQVAEPDPASKEIVVDASCANCCLNSASRYGSKLTLHTFPRIDGLSALVSSLEPGEWTRTASLRGSRQADMP